VQCTFNIDTPTFVEHLFNDWAFSVGVRLKKFMLVDASALCWALWTCRNHIVFDKVSMKTYIQLLYREVHTSFATGCSYKSMKRTSHR
jgi:hypothetical protein